MGTKLTIHELEARMDRGDRISILPDGKIKTEETLSKRELCRMYKVFVGDDHAKIYWGGKHWVSESSSAAIFTDLKKALAMMELLRQEDCVRTIRLLSWQELDTEL